MGRWKETNRATLTPKKKKKKTTHVDLLRGAGTRYKKKKKKRRLFIIWWMVINYIQTVCVDTAVRKQHAPHISLYSIGLWRGEKVL